MSERPAADGMEPKVASAAAALVAEVEAARSAVAWAPIVADRLDLSGADRVRFLHNLVTCDVKVLAAGSAARGYFTNGKGGVLASVTVIALADRLRCLLPAGRGAAIRAHCERYRIADRVEIEERGDLGALELRGARAPELLTALVLPIPEPGVRIEAASEGGARAVRSPTAQRFELEWSTDGDALVAALTQAGASLGLVALSPEAVEILRVEDGELSWGVDYGEENFPQEAGDEEAVSFTKGCYLGQEVIARIHYRGGVQRVARGLRFAGDPPALGTALLHDGRAAGRVTSVARSPRFGAIGLALVHRRVGEPPATVELEGGGSARLTVLPFA